MSKAEEQLIDARLANRVLRDALRRAVAERDKYRWQRDQAAAEWASYEEDYRGEYEGDVTVTLKEKLADLDRIWRERQP